MHEEGLGPKTALVNVTRRVELLQFATTVPEQAPAIVLTPMVSWTVVVLPEIRWIAQGPVEETTLPQRGLPGLREPVKLIVAEVTDPPPLTVQVIGPVEIVLVVGLMVVDPVGVKVWAWALVAAPANRKAPRVRIRRNIVISHVSRPGGRLTYSRVNTPGVNRFSP